MSISPDNNAPAVKLGVVPEIINLDPYLTPFKGLIDSRVRRAVALRSEIVAEAGALTDFASGHEYFGLHFQRGEWIFREWAPNAQSIYLIGEFNSWQDAGDFALSSIDEHGIWEIRVPAHQLKHGDLYKINIHWADGSGHRIPAYARRVVQDDATKIFSAQVWRPPARYRWKHAAFRRPTGPPLIYEAHTGMSQEDGKVGTYTEFKERILPRIIDAGYDTLQLMAVQEHPYYGSFGYHVSSFFAASSRFGTPEELKALIDEAHGAGLAVIIDLVHSHSVKNEIEGLSRFDGTEYQYFHQGSRGYHSAWDSRCFDYSKKEVLHFLLSNCRYWLDEFHVDGFRFDGVTSMLYKHHGLNAVFSSYEDYYDGASDSDALAYLALANSLIHELRPDAITIAEEVSGYPGIALSEEAGGIGFDYRLGMGLPDYWIKLVKDVNDEDWNTGALWHELTNRRRGEKTISYAESHDQALVGDQALIFRLIGKEMYDNMHTDSRTVSVDRGLALHKLIRLITAAAGGDGYLNFMGNEYGHPEWIDFPREGNNWSYHYARRQWSLRDNPNLFYYCLAEFDRDMLTLIKDCDVLADPHPSLIQNDHVNQVISFRRSNLCFIFNFNPTKSFTNYAVNTGPGKFELTMDTDRSTYGGQGRLHSPQKFHSTSVSGVDCISVYLPTRTAMILTM